MTQPTPALRPDRRRPHRHSPRHHPGPPAARGRAGHGRRPAARSRRAARRALGAEAPTDPQALIDDPRVEAVAITCASTAHADLIVAAARAGKAVFVEKPMAMTLADADRAIAACRGGRVPLQVGFNRRFATDFAAAHQVVADGGIGTPQLLRSLTRDPGLANPAAVPPWTIFTQTLIHDFDTLNWFNAGATAGRGQRHGGRPRRAGLQGRAGCSTPRSSRSATTTARSRPPRRASRRPTATTSAERCSARPAWSPPGSPAQLAWRTGAPPASSSPTARADTELFPDAYAGELAAFCDAVRGACPGGRPARTPAPRCGSPWPASSPSRPAAPSRCATPTGRRPMTTPQPPRPVHPGGLLGDGLPRPARRRADQADQRAGFEVEIWDWTRHDIDALAALRDEGVVFSSMTGYVRGRLSDPEGADELLADRGEVRSRRAAARHPAAQPARDRPRRRGPSRPARARGDRPDVARRTAYPRARRRARRARGGHLRAREPQHRRRPPRRALRDRR